MGGLTGNCLRSSTWDFPTTAELVMDQTYVRLRYIRHQCIAA